MPRIARIIKESGVFHVISRGNNKQNIFHDEQDFEKFLEILDLHKKAKPFYLYHYALLNNHFHLLLEPKAGQTISKILQGIKLSYVYHYRKKYSYYGHLFQDRFKSILIQKEDYLLSCGAYIELNPVRAGIANKPEGYPYSSYYFYAYGQKNPLIDPNPFYPGLAKSSEVRQKRYKEFTESQLKKKESYSAGNYIGTKRFEKKMKDLYGIEKNSPKRGRPKKDV